MAVSFPLSQDLVETSRGWPSGDPELLWREVQGRRGELMALARQIRDAAHPYITYSRNVFLPLTNLCRYACPYCTFFRSPWEADGGYMTPEQVRSTASKARALGCTEALFTLGERPEDGFPEALAWLREHGYERTNEYLADSCLAVLQSTGLLPHSNPGVLGPGDLRRLRELNASMGIMLESSSTALGAPGGVHYGIGSKHPVARIRTMEEAGKLRIPWTTGLLLGIGDGPGDWIRGLLTIRDLHQRYGHIQEVILQPFVPHARTPMGATPPFRGEDLVALVALARHLLPPDVSIQAPPNLAPGLIGELLRAGANDFGGISPLTVDYINPDHPWPWEEELRRAVVDQGLRPRERLPIYPSYALDAAFLHGEAGAAVEGLMDDEGYTRGSLP